MHTTQWGAITIVTVNSPVMGKIAKVSFERCLGTLVGGWLGCACFMVTRHPAWTAVISFLVALASSMLAVKLKLDYSCKLLSITFIVGARGVSCLYYLHSPKQVRGFEGYHGILAGPGWRGPV